jgi:hypothetical protein
LTREESALFGDCRPTTAAGSITGGGAVDISIDTPLPQALDIVVDKSAGTLGSTSRQDTAAQTIETTHITIRFAFIIWVCVHRDGQANP